MSENQITLVNIEPMNDALKLIKEQLNKAIRSNDNNDLDSVSKVVDAYKAMELCIISLDKLQKVAIEIDKQNKQAKEDEIK